MLVSWGPEWEGAAVAAQRQTALHYQAARAVNSALHTAEPTPVGVRVIGTCDDCLYFDLEFDLCRAESPTAVMAEDVTGLTVTAMWPSVKRTDWCGRFTQRWEPPS
jgi:hypothetical protein